jgi:hypothetical protein
MLRLRGVGLVTGPRGGATCTPGGLRKVTVTLDEVSIKALDAEVAIRQRAGQATASRSDVIRRLAKSLRNAPSVFP